MLSQSLPRYLRGSRALSICRGRVLSTAAASDLREHWTFIPDFLSPSEQSTLLDACLKQLNDAESGLIRRRRRRYEATLAMPIRGAFLPDEYYHFEEVCPSYEKYIPVSSDFHIALYLGPPRPRHSTLSRDASWDLAHRRRVPRPRGCRQAYMFMVSE
jgi:hypothetical protein